MSRTKILIIEDEIIAALELKTEIEKLGCIVTDIAYTQQKVLDSIRNNKPDIILSDINLGKSPDGIQIVQKVQKIQNIPILYITAFSDDDTIARALSTNPLGYIVKPFKPEDIKTNIRLAIYKINLFPAKKINKNHHYLGNNFYYDLTEEKLYYKNKFINLGIKEKRLLSILIDANYSKVRFSDLEEIVWEGNKPSQGALRTLVYRLKGKLGNDIIEVTYGYGYNLKKPL